MSLILLLVGFLVLVGSEPTPPPELTISHVSALLTWESEGVVIRATGPNCFYWSLVDDSFVGFEMHPRPTSTSPLVAMCAHAVRVFPRPMLAGRQLPRHSTQLIARDAKTGQLLKCDLFVDTVFTLRLLTTLRRLYLDEMQLIEIQALDVAENVFLTPGLSGLQFEWESSTNAMGLSAVDSELEPGSGTGLDVEVVDGGDWMRLARGAEIGKSLLEVKMLYEGLSRIPRVAVEFCVVDRFELEPGDNLFVVPFASFKYRLFRLRDDKRTFIRMPSSFRWASSNTSVVSVDPRMGEVEGSRDGALGYSSIRVYDSDFVENEMWGLVTVVEPVRIRVRFELVEGKNPYVDPSVWRSDDANLILDRKYYVRTEALDEMGHVILRTSNMHFTMSIRVGEKLIRMDRSGDKATTLGVGELVIHAKMRTDDGRKLQTTDVFFIYEAVEIDFEKGATVHLPIDTGVRQEWYARASGGTGVYLWDVVDDSVASLSRDIQVMPNVIISRAVGRTVVVGFDRDNVHNWDARPLEVSKPHSVKFLPSFRESAVGSDLCLRVAVRNALLDHFSNYTRLNLTFTVAGAKGEQVFRLSVNSRQCEVSKYDVFAFRAEQVGFTTVDVQYTRFMRDSVRVAAFPPFEIASPEFIRDRPIVVSLGAGVPIRLSGGPIAWKDPSSVITPREEIQRRDLVQFDVVKKMRQYYIGCLDFGKQTIRFLIQNDIPDDGAWPTVASIVKIFSCQPPESLKLVPLDAETRAPYVPSSTVPPPTVYKVRNDQTLPLQMQVFSPHANRFVNFSTLVTSWALQDENAPPLARLHIVPPPARKKKVIFPHDERPLELFKQTGLIHALGELLRYDRPKVKRSGANMRSLPPSAAFQPIDNLVQIRVTSGMAIRFFCGLSLDEELAYLRERNESITTADRCLLRSGFFCEKTPHLLFPSRRGLQLEGLVSGGSGRFDISINDTSVTELRLGVDARFTLVANTEGSVELRAVDTLFSGAAAAAVSSVVKVSDVDGVSVVGSRFVKERTSGYVQIAPWDGEGNVFDPVQVGEMEYFMEMALVEGFPPPDELANLKDCGSGKFEVYGKKVGQVNLVAYVTNAAGRTLRNEVFRLVVYAEFQALPARLLLVPGAIYQIGTSGGPVGVSSITTEFEKRYELLNRTGKSGKVIDINERGLVTAMEYGQLTVMIRKFSKSRELIAELQCEIFVVELYALSTQPSPALLLYESNPAPASIVGSSWHGPLTPLSLQSPFVGLKYEVSGPFGVQRAEPFGGFRIQGRESGHGSVRASFSFSHPRFRSYERSIHLPVTVEERLKGHCSSCQLLLPPRSSLTMESNKEGVLFSGVRLQQQQQQQGGDTDMTTDLLSVEPQSGVVTTGESSGIAGVLGTFAGRHVMHLMTIEDPAFVDFVKAAEVRIELKHSTSKRLQFVFRAHEGDSFASVAGVPLKVTMNDREIVLITDHASKAKTPSVRTYHVKTIGSGVATVEFSSVVEGRILNPLYVQFVVKPKITVDLPFDRAFGHYVAYIGDSFGVEALPLMQNETESFWSSRSPVFEISRRGHVTALSEGTGKVVYESAVTGQTSSSPIRVRRLTNTQLVSANRIAYSPGGTADITFRMLDGAGEVYSRPPEGHVRRLSVSGFCTYPSQVRVLETDQMFEPEGGALYVMRIEMMEGLSYDTTLRCSARVSYPTRDDDVALPSISLVLGISEPKGTGTDDPLSTSRLTEEEKKAGGPSFFSQVVVAGLIIGVTVFVYHVFLSNFCR